MQSVSWTDWLKRLIALQCARGAKSGAKDRQCSPSTQPYISAWLCSCPQWLYLSKWINIRCFNYSPTFIHAVSSSHFQLCSLSLAVSVEVGQRSGKTKGLDLKNPEHVWYHRKVEGKIWDRGANHQWCCWECAETLTLTPRSPREALSGRCALSLFGKVTSAAQTKAVWT